ncbi:MAG: hypothetical protein ACP5TZ_03710 [Nitrososphaeria archaeon]
MESFFVEAKWYTNNAIAAGIFDASYKDKKVQVKVGDSFEPRNISVQAR